MALLSTLPFTNLDAAASGLTLERIDGSLGAQREVLKGPAGLQSLLTSLPFASDREVKAIAAQHGDVLADGVIAHASSGAIRAAWLTRPTTRYGHGVLGDAIEAGGVAALLKDGRIVSYRLSEDSVFEDLEPRIGDLDGDGEDEIVLVHSYLDRGAAVSVLAVQGASLKIVAETEAIGTRNRWLNPSILGNLDDSKRLTLGLVRTPHIGGQLQLWQFDGRRLRLMARRNGFSNHSIGSRALGLSAVVYKGAQSRLVVPNAVQSALVILNGTDLTPLAQIALPAKPVGDFQVIRAGNGKQSVLVPLGDGHTYRLTGDGTLFD